MSGPVTEPPKGWSPYCGIGGCTVKSSYGAYMRKHRALPHRRCSCGWVGVYINKHAATVRRYGDTGEHVEIERVGGT